VWEKVGALWAKTWQINKLNFYFAVCSLLIVTSFAANITLFSEIKKVSLGEDACGFASFLRSCKKNLAPKLVYGFIETVFAVVSIVSAFFYCSRIYNNKLCILGLIFLCLEVVAYSVARIYLLDELTKENAPNVFKCINAAAAKTIKHFNDGMAMLGAAAALSAVVAAFVCIHNPAGILILTLFPFGHIAYVQNKLLTAMENSPK